jgi:vitamin B12 transporter
MRLRFSVLLLSVFVFFSTRAIYAQTTGSAHGATIHGTVYDPDGLIVSGARIDLLNSLAAVTEIQTNSGGVYIFEGLRGGTFTVVANRSGFTSISTDVDLPDGGTHTVDLHLKLSAAQEQVVVSASLGGATASQIGSSVSVVTHDEMENQGTETLADSLRNVPGVEINRTGQMGAVTSAFIRGGNSNYNLVMVDGIPMNDFGGAFDLAPLPVP